MNPLFTLRLRLFRKEYDNRLIIVRVFEDAPSRYNDRASFSAEVTHGGKVIFPRGQLYYGLGMGTSEDDNGAKECALALVELKPGDTDAEYFSGYTPEQIEWANEYGDVISMERENRYCDPETGGMR